MKILFLTRRFYPDDGGVEKHIYEISKVLIKKGNTITLVTQSQGKINNLEGINILRVSKVPRNRSENIHIWMWFWHNRKIIKEADVVHAHDVFFWLWPSKLLFLSKKCFITFHGYETYPISLKAIIVRKISEKMANGNIIVGDFIKKWYNTTPNYVIYGGVNIPRKVVKAKNRKSAVFIGRLDEHTGILDYARTVEIIKNDYPDFKFEILGDGKYFSKLKKYDPLGFKTNPELYLQKNNFAFVSRYLSILEALANRRLIFAHYDNPVKEDYLKMAPFSKFIIISNNPKEIAEKVKYYLKNEKETDKLTQEGNKWVKKQTWEGIVNVYEKLWKI